MENAPKYQYSIFTKNKQGQVVVRTDDKEEFDDLIAQAVQAVEKENERQDMVSSVEDSKNFAKDIEGEAKHCSKCNSTDLTYREGVSKKNNKPWKADVCQKCGTFNWIRG